MKSFKLIHFIHRPPRKEPLISLYTNFWRQQLFQRQDMKFSDKNPIYFLRFSNLLLEIWWSGHARTSDQTSNLFIRNQRISEMRVKPRQKLEKCSRFLRFLFIKDYTMEFEMANPRKPTKDLHSGDLKRQIHENRTTPLSANKT